MQFEIHYLKLMHSHIRRIDIRVAASKQTNSNQLYFEIGALVGLSQIIIRTALVATILVDVQSPQYDFFVNTL